MKTTGMQADAAIRMAAGALDNVRWREMSEHGAPDGTYEWYYAEDGMYVIRHKRLRTVRFISAKSPEDAWEKLKRIYLARK